MLISVSHVTPRKHMLPIAAQRCRHRLRRRRGRQREGDELGSRRRLQVSAATGGDDDVLPAILAHERHGHRMRRCVERHFPQLFSGFRFERAQAAVGGRADEDQPARRRDAAAEVQRARAIDPF